MHSQEPPSKEKPSRHKCRIVQVQVWGSHLGTFKVILLTKKSSVSSLLAWKHTHADAKASSNQRSKEAVGSTAFQLCP